MIEQVVDNDMIKPIMIDIAKHDIAKISVYTWDVFSEFQKWLMTLHEATDLSCGNQT